MSVENAKARVERPFGEFSLGVGSSISGPSLPTSPACTARALITMLIEVLILNGYRTQSTSWCRRYSLSFGHGYTRIFNSLKQPTKLERPQSVLEGRIHNPARSLG